MPTLFRTVAAAVTGALLYLAFDPPSFLRVFIFGWLAISVFWVGWWWAEYLDRIREHNDHVTERFVAMAQTLEHRADWHYQADGQERCGLDGLECSTIRRS